MPDDRLWRDTNGRLTFDLPHVTAADYPSICKALAVAFALMPGTRLIAGLDQMFRDYRLGEQILGLEWDIRRGFLLVARTPNADPLVREIADWLSRSQWAGTDKPV
ncbi:hypothetical protein [Fimbriiglobus ruber]|uniref:Uncharacterized protein n=1 Tax=Fimbriiglobus ruber TaxID=1908690 RepID=A0A225DIN4_9BACT|nr:hypothetical protein [Fimbriiglobus ruber]OWK36235.1 hypothetical protein FRUB_08798 [Fimbriiglobus ruber]